MTHPKRCETCKNWKGHWDVPFCKYWDDKIPITKYGMDLISHVGCASHISEQSTHEPKPRPPCEECVYQSNSAEHDARIRKEEREGVLDALEKMRCDYENNLNSVTTYYNIFDKGLIEGKNCVVIILKHWIQELREEQP